MNDDDLTVFISYRRADSSADAGRLYDALRRRFGRENLFMDVDSLRPGEDWVDAVEAALTRSDVLLAIIGPSWAGAKDEDGELRLHKELDRVRLEIEAALRNEKPVIPVLVEAASMPTSDQLPDSLKALLRRHAIRISHATFESDLSALVRALRTIDKQRHPNRAHTAITAATAATAAATVAATRPPAITPQPASPPVHPDPAPVTQPYVSPQPAPPAPPVAPVGQAAYTAPPVYPYQAPAYGYTEPAVRRGTSPVVLGLVGLVVVFVIGIVLMAGLHTGPFALTAVASPTPTVEPTDVPTDEPTDAPTDEPTLEPSPSEEPTASDLASEQPTAPSSSPDRTPYPSAAFDPLWAIVPADITDSCEPTSNYDIPELFCYVASEDKSFWYAAYPDIDELNAAYDAWLGYYDVERETANCFDDVLPTPCEGPYQLGGYDPAGRVVDLVDDDDVWMFWTHEPALVLG